MMWKNQERVGPGNQLKKVFQERGSDPVSQLLLKGTYKEDLKGQVEFGNRRVIGDLDKRSLGGMMGTEA